MILIPRNGTPGDYKTVLDNYELKKGKVLSSNAKILPPQIIINGLLKRMNGKRDYYKDFGIDEGQKKERMAQDIVSLMQKHGGKISACVYSPGGSRTIQGEKEWNELDKSDANTVYVVMEVNGIVVLEPLGQKNNATIIVRKR